MWFRMSCSRSWSETITYSRKVSDLFIYFASLKICPSTLDLVQRSLPARSTRWSLDVRIISLARSLPSKAIVKMQCDRELDWFIGVAETWRTKFPMVSKSIPSCSFYTWWIDKFLRCKFPQSSSYSAILFHCSNGSSACFLSKRSYAVSL